MANKMNELFKNEAFCVRFFDALEDTTALQAVLADYGIEATAEETAEIAKTAKAQIAQEELNEEALDEVAGGIIGWVIAGVASGAFFGYQVYKARKGLNETFCH